MGGSEPVDKKGNMKLIYESKKPGFAILCDSLQWVLALTPHKRKDGSTTWEDRTYHPNLCNLLDELAEHQFRSNTKKLNDLRKLDASVERVYGLITKVAERFEGVGERWRGSRKP